MSTELVCEFKWNPDVQNRINTFADSMVDRGLIDVFCWALQDRLFAKYQISIDPNEDDQIEYYYLIRSLDYLRFQGFLAALDDRNLTPYSIEFLDF